MISRLAEWGLGVPASWLARGEIVSGSSLTGWAFALAAVLGLSFVAIGLWRARTRPRAQRAALLTLQGATVALALALLWQPTLAIDRIDARGNVVVLLVDHSRSMAFGSRGETRLARGTRALEAGVLDRIREAFTLRVYSFGERTRRIESLDPPEVGAERTRLLEAVREALAAAATAPLAGVVVLTDGGAEDVEAASSALAEIAASGVPVHTIGVGRERLDEDVELAEVRLPSPVLRDAAMVASLRIRHARDAKARIVVREGDRALATRDVELDRDTPDQWVTIELPAEAPGTRDLEVSIDPLPGEQILANNVQRRLIEVAESRRRVLYVEGEPRWEYKFIRRALAPDASIELVSLLRTTENKLYRQGVSAEDELADGFPTERRALFAYDAVIVGSFSAAELNPEQQSLLSDFVSERGGSLLLIGGADALGSGGWGRSTLRDALPTLLPQSELAFSREPAQARPTRAGSGLAWLRLEREIEQSLEAWSTLPELADFQALGKVKPGATVLLEAVRGSQALPLLVTQRFGRGRSTVFGTGGTWRWRMGLPSDDTRHERFWRQLLRELVSAVPAPVEMSVRTASRAEVGGAAMLGEPSFEAQEEGGLEIRVELRDDEFRPVVDALRSLVVAGRGEEVRELPLEPTVEAGVYRAELAGAPGETYRVALGDDVVRYVRAPEPPGEDFSPEQNRALLERLASLTGGRYFTTESLFDLPEVLQASRAGVTRRELVALWDRPLWFVLLVALKAGEWGLRRRWGVL